MPQQLTDLEKQQLITILYVHRICAPGLDRLALRIVESISAEDEKNAALLTVSYYLAACGNFALADEVAYQQLTGYARAAALAAIGVAVANTNPNLATKYLKDAEEFLLHTTNADDRTILLQRIAQGHSNLKNWQRAKELAIRISQIEDRVSALCEIAENLWRSGEVDAATLTLSDARVMADEAPLSERTGALNDVAKALLQMDRRTEAIEAWEQAVAFASHSNESSKWLFSICEKLVSLGNRLQARQVALLIQNDARRNEALRIAAGTP